MFTNSQMLRTFRYPGFSAHWQQQQEKQPVWKYSAALSVMSDNEKINHLRERASSLRLSLEEVELHWSIKRTLESTGGSALSVLWLENGKEILLHPGHATKESWDPATTQKACWEKPISLLANARVYALKGPACEWSPMGFHWGQEGHCWNDAGRLQMVASLCFSQTLITLCEWGSLFYSVVHEYLAGNRLVWKQSTSSASSASIPTLSVPSVSSVWLSIPDVCCKCLNETHTHCHCLWECQKLQNFWKYLMNCLSDMFKTP